MNSRQSRRARFVSGARSPIVSASSPISSVPLMRRRGWSRNSGSLRSRPTWTARCRRCSRSGSSSISRDSARSATASSGTSAFSSARAGRPETPTRRPETVEQVIEMLRRPLPEGPALTKVLERLERVSLGGRLPEPRTRVRDRSLRRADDHVPVAARRRPRTQQLFARRLATPRSSSWWPISPSFVRRITGPRCTRS